MTEWAVAYDLLLLSPSFELMDVSRKETSQKLRKAEFHQLLFYPVLHLADRQVRHRKLAILVTMTAVFFAFAAVSLRTAAFFITSQRHAAALTIFIRLFHILAPLMNSSCF